MRTRSFLLAGLLVALLVAGVGSYYASSHPDGLEHVAQQTGFLDSADDPKDTGSPFAGYETKGVDDARLGGGLAGVAGVLLTLVIGGGLFRVLRRREAPSSTDAA
ncbi:MULTISPECIES: PDGLE domain-containing protein [unclassified Nocardioides]|uniref:PDGLE domain-containing protein n=1 Tax=unclassified Nocardioides TaxID=2615069 RepID=UPI0006F7D46A|nr:MULTISPECIES: PDGLE domain-containing protein [unclassified Nocardioides]KRA38128.1 hypothetical protein ASD81_05575 [Nocardioides sp. Root614]KRA92088.1 hypothetical protein ASD84_05840 [Nocardioides sp. Root682]